MLLHPTDDLEWELGVSTLDSGVNRVWGMAFGGMVEDLRLKRPMDQWAHGEKTAGTSGAQGSPRGRALRGREANSFGLGYGQMGLFAFLFWWRGVPVFVLC